jgi:protein-L-isoaspartate(D-aspartate) O-methyltransferase
MRSNESQKGLVTAIEHALGHPLTETVRQAFLTVDRRHFVPFHYRKEGYEWKEQPSGEEIYDNAFFWTHLDQRGIPDSSSSQPSLMASMLETLDLVAGLRVLEIGTGSGYNTALLATLVGPTGRVISTEIAPALAQQAALRCIDLPWVRVEATDGLLGFPSEAPYDRIIATGSSRRLPRTWVEQLAVGGLLLASLSFAVSTFTPLCRLTKQEDGTVSGELLEVPAYFMALHHQDQPAKSVEAATDYEAFPLVECERTPINVAQLLRDPSYVLFLESHVPGLCSSLWLPRGSTDRRPPGLCVVSQEQETLMTCLPQTSLEPSSWWVEVRGSTPLWSSVKRVYREWEQQGRPEIGRYRVSVDTEGRPRIALLTEVSGHPLF